MKTRDGFVSNSSSSSFVVASKRPLDADLVFDRLFAVPKDNFFYQFARKCADVLSTADKCTDYAGHWFDDWKEMEGNGWTFYEGWTSTDSWDNQAEMWLVSQSIDFESDDLIVKKEGGF